VGPRRGENHCCHTRAKSTTKNNEYHGALERHSRNEDSTDRVENNADKEARKTSRIGTPPRTSNTDVYAVGGREDKYGIGMVRGRNINAGGVNNVVNGGANRKICVDEGKRKGTNRKVPQFGQGNTRSTHHLSGLGRATCQCWGHVGCRPILRRKDILGANLFLEKISILGKT
jgi:hypothetical protein